MTPEEYAARTDAQSQRRADFDYGLTRARRQRENAERQRDIAMQRIARLAAQATAAGVPMTEVAQLTGLSRQSLYDLLKRYPAPRAASTDEAHRTVTA